MQSRRVLVMVALSILAATGLASPAGSATSSSNGSSPPGPHDDAAAATAGRQAGPPGGSGPRTAAAGVGPQQVMSARVFATQYNPSTAGSVEASVPDQCVKFAALANTAALSSHGCSAGYALGLDYRVLVTRDSGQSAALPVREVGPWNLDDNYWDFGPGNSRPRRLFADLPSGTPEAQAAFYGSYNVSPNCKKLDKTTPSGHSGSADQFGRCVLNPAGLDLSVAAASQLGIGNLQNEWVTVSFLWEPIRTAITSVNSGQNIDVAGSSKADGTRVIQWPSTGGANQQWRFEGVAPNTYRIVSVNSGKVLDVTGSSKANGAPIVQWSWTGNPNQQWRFDPVGEGVYRIVSVNSGEVLDVTGSSKANGAPIVQWPSTGNANQQWRLNVLGDG